MEIIRKSYIDMDRFFNSIGIKYKKLKQTAVHLENTAVCFVLIVEKYIIYDKPDGKQYAYASGY